MHVDAHYSSDHTTHAHYTMKDQIPRDVQVKKASDIHAPDGPQTDGMIRMPAIVDKSDQICGTGTHSFQLLKDQSLTTVVMVAKPHTASAVHHHGEEGTP